LNFSKPRLAGRIGLFDEMLHYARPAAIIISHIKKQHQQGFAQAGVLQEHPVPENVKIRYSDRCLQQVTAGGKVTAGKGRQRRAAAGNRR